MSSSANQRKTWSYNTNYPSLDDLIKKAKKRIPRFAFEYLAGGCNEDVNLVKNTSELRNVELLPYYLSEHKGSDLSVELFGHTYDAPFGVAPIGLQGLIWPNYAISRSNINDATLLIFQHDFPKFLGT